MSSLYTWSVREDLHPVLKYSLRSVKLILIVKLMYVCTACVVLMCVHRMPLYPYSWNVTYNLL